MSEDVASPYLEQEVLSASPAKLRWLLINKAVQLTKVLQHCWQEAGAEPSQWSLWLRDVLTELLAAVHGTDELAKRVSDLYVFMIRLLTEAELERDASKLVQLLSLLEIEAETWSQVQAQLSGRVPLSADIDSGATRPEGTDVADGLTSRQSVAAVPTPNLAPHFAPTYSPSLGPPFDLPAGESSLNLDA